MAMARPDAPTGVAAAVDGADAVNVSWSAPAGGGAPTAYEVTPTTGGVAQRSTIVFGTPPATSVRIGGLSAGTTYTFTVRALNGGGAGPQSAASNAVTPLAATLPDPTGGGPGVSTGGPGVSTGGPGVSTGGPGVSTGPGSPSDSAAGATIAPPPGAALAPNTVLAAVLRARFVRAKKDGKRTLELVVALRETVDLGVLVTLGKRTVVSRPRTRLFRGDRTVRIVLPRKTGAGRASVRIVFRDGAGAARTVRRTLSIPSLRGKKR